MVIKTTYISNIKKIYNEEDIFLIVTRYPPKYDFKQENIILAKYLSPEPALFSRRKKGEISIPEWKEEYIKQIQRQNLDKQVLDGIINGGKTVWFICFEKDPTDCHRKLLATHIESISNNKIIYEEEEIVLQKSKT